MGFLACFAHSPRQVYVVRVFGQALKQPTEFFDKLESLAPLDDSYRDQVRSLVISHGFRTPQPGLVEAYFRRGTNLVPTGPWIARSVLTGIGETSADRTTDASEPMLQIMQLVRDHYPAAYTEQVEFAGLTNTLERIAVQQAERRLASDKPRIQAYVATLLDRFRKSAP